MNPSTDELIKIIEMGCDCDICDSAKARLQGRLDVLELVKERLLKFGNLATKEVWDSNREDYKLIRDETLRNSVIEYLELEKEISKIKQALGDK